MLSSLLYVLICRLLELVVLRFRSSRSDDLEIVVLRHELAVLRRQVAGLPSPDTDRVFLAAASRLLPWRRRSSFFVRPETLLRWHLGWWCGAGPAGGGALVGRRSIQSWLL